MRLRFPLGSRGPDGPLAPVERRVGRFAPLAILLGLVATALEGLGIGLLVPLTSIMLGPEPGGHANPLLAAVVGLAERIAPGRPILGLSAIVLALVLAKGAVQLVNAHLMATLEGAAGRDIRDALARKALYLDYRFFLRHDTARLVTIVDTESWKATEAVRVILDVSVAGAAVVAFGVMLFLADWRLSLIVLAGVALSRLGQWALSRRVARLGRVAIGSNHALAGQMMQVVRAIRVIRLFGQEGREERRFAELSEDVRRTMLRVARWSAASQPLLELFLSALILLVLLCADRLGVGLPATAAFLVLLYRAQSPLMRMGHSLVHLAGLRGSIEEVEWLLGQPGAAERGGGRPIRSPDRPIHFKGVGFSYGDAPAVEGIDLVLEPGSVTGLVGRSGSGKSTVVNLLCRLIEPTAGRILFGEEDAAALDPRAWRDLLALAGQDVDLIAGTVAQNIAYGAPDADMAEIEDAARLADAHGFIAALPQGYATHLGALGFGLSGGQRQRIGLARALLRRPEVLILDEATSAVDGISERTIMQLLRQHRRFGRAVIVSHRRGALAMCDRAVVLDGGRIVEQGPLRQLAWYRDADDAGEETGEPAGAAS